MYFATLILFLVPLWMLLLAWRTALDKSAGASHATWRRNIQIASLAVATVALVLAVCFKLSWTHSGGSPHGMMPRPGLWVMLRPVVLSITGVAVVLTCFGWGKPRLLTVAGLISIVLVELALSMLEFD